MKATKFIASVLIILFPSAIMCQNSQKNAKSASSVIELIIKNTGSPTLPKTVDIIKEGDPRTPVKGIVTTMFATMEVMKKAVEMNCNLIIAHEPLYYNHTDETNQFQNDPVVLEKQRYIKDNRLVIWVRGGFNNNLQYYVKIIQAFFFHFTHSFRLLHIR